jgi:hypothetical protein
MTDSGHSEYEVTEAAQLCAATIALVSAHSDRASTICLGLQHSLEIAEKFTRTGTFEQGEDETSTWHAALEAAIVNHGDRDIFVVANSSNATLAMLAKCIATKKKVWVEDCSFSRRFVAPLCGHASNDITLVPIQQILRSGRAAANGTFAGGPCIMVSILDRWATRHIEFDIKMEILRAKFYISPTDALIALVHPAPFLLDGVNLTQLRGYSIAANEPIPKAVVVDLTGVLLKGVVRLLVEYPTQYLGPAALVSRSLRWRRDEARECEAIITAVFRSCLRDSNLVDAMAADKIRTILATAREE